MKTRLRKQWAVPRLAAGVTLFAVTAVAGGSAFAAFSGDPDSLAWYSADETTVTVNPDKVATPLKFYDAAGAEITTGTVAAKPFVPYASVAGELRPADTAASLFAYTANPGLVQGAWSGEQLTAANTYPVAAAPGVVGNNPAVKVAASARSLAEYIEAFPSTTSNPGFQDVYEIRLRTGNAKGVGTSYASTYIKVSGASWSVVGSPVDPPTSISTTTTSVVPATAATNTAFNVTATVTASDSSAPTGSVEILEGVNVLASGPVSGTPGTATISVPGLTAGSHSLVARFVPTGTVYQTSSAAAKTVNVSNPAVSTTTTSVVPAAARYGTAFNVSATVTAADATAPTGTVQVLRGNVVLASKAVSGTPGTATVPVPGTRLLPGTSALVVKFVPAGSGYATSSAAPKNIAVAKAISTTTAKVVKSPLKKSKKPQVVVTIKANGVPKPTGVIKIYSGTKLLKTVTLTASSNGKITITLPKFSKAKTYKLTAKYAGSGVVGASNSKTVSIKITK